MINFIQFLIYALKFVVLSVTGSNYNCKYVEPATNCLDYEKTINTEADKQLILDKINTRRNQVASGELRSLPSAAKMLKMEWNKELEFSAQQWANQCVNASGSNEKDTCFQFGKEYVGQNIATVYGDVPRITPSILVDMWYIELLNINKSLISKYQSPSTENHHPHYDYFTQLVWGESNQVGCGGVKFKIQNHVTERKRPVYRLVCNFAPRGNLEGKPVYVEGEICSGCPAKSCDVVYNSLCSTKSSFENPITTENVITLKSNLTILNNPNVSNASISINTDSTTSKIYTVNEGTIPQTETIAHFAKESEEDEDNFYASYNYLSHIHKYSIQPITTTTIKTPCSVVTAFDEIVEVLKNRLISDPAFRELLLTTKSSSIGEESNLTFSNVAAFINQIYSKRESMTTVMPRNNIINSTLLVDLVESVIFRGSVGHTVAEETNTEMYPQVSPIKIQAEMARVKPNNEFTGHYFFPEDVEEEEINQESTSETIESYYESSDIPVSDVIREIGDIKRESESKSFLDEVLESEIGSESGTSVNSTTFTTRILNLYKSGQDNMKKFLQEIEKNKNLNSEMKSLN